MSKVLVSNIKGPDGNSAYDLAVEGGFEGSEQEWLLSLKGDVTPEAVAARDAATDAATTANSAAAEAAAHALAVQAVTATNDGIMAPILADPESASGSHLRDTFVQFRNFDGSAVAAGSVVVVTLTEDGTDIHDITVGEV